MENETTGVGKLIVSTINRDVPFIELVLPANVPPNTRCFRDVVPDISEVIRGIVSPPTVLLDKFAAVRLTEMFALAPDGRVAV